MAARNTILRPPRSRSLPSERLGPARCHVPDDLLFMHEKYPNDRRFMVGSERRQKKYAKISRTAVNVELTFALKPRGQMVQRSDLSSA